MSDSPSSRNNARVAGERLLAAHASEDPFAAAFKATRMPMIITDPRQDDNPVIFANNAFCELCGYSPDEIVGRNCRMLQGPETDRNVVSRINKAVAASQSIAVDILNYRKDGSTFWNALFISPVRDSSGEVIYFFASQLDFSHMKNKEAELAAGRHVAELEVVRRTQELQRALEAKTLLVHEVDHRVKNNLLTIASLIKLQARMSTNDIAKNTLRSVLERVEALSTVQRKLFTTEDVGRFDVADFTREIAVDMISALKRKDIKLNLDLSEVLIPAPKASPLALILNELIGDAVRRGLRDGGGTISVAVRRGSADFQIEVTDDVQLVTVDPDEMAFSRLILDSSAKQLGAIVDEKHEAGQKTVRVLLPVE